MADPIEYDNEGNPIHRQVTPGFQEAAMNQGIAGPAPAAAPASPFNAEQFRKGWAYGGAGFGTRTNLGELQQYIASNPGFAGVTIKGEKVYDPQGRYMFDAIGNFSGGNPSGMTRIALQGNSSYQRGKPKPSKSVKPVSSAASGGVPKTAAAPAAVSTGGFNTGGLGTQASSLFDLLMSRAKASENIDASDPIVKAQTDAYRTEGTRARRNYLSDVAEEAGPIANLRGERRMSAERLGQDVGGFQAQALRNAQDARRASIESALAGATGFLTDEQRMSLTNELERLRLSQQESQYGRSLAQDNSQFNRNLTSLESQFGRNLGQRAYEYDTNRFDSLYA
jgi:hypothetical protein